MENLNSILGFWDFLVVGIYAVVLIGIGMWVSFKETDDEDLFLAGRSLGWKSIGLSIYGTNIGPSFLLGSCGVAYASGMVAANFEWLAWFFLLLLGMFFVPFYMKTKINTLPQFMKERFGNKVHSYLSWYTLFSTIVMWLGAVLYAGGVLLSQVMNWPLWVSVVVLCLIAMSFTVAGGLKAVAITDSFQSVLMIIGATVLTIFALIEVGSVERLLKSVPADYWSMFRSGSDPNYPWYAIILGYPVLGIWFWCSDQTIVQRALGGKSVVEAQKGTLFAAFLKITPPLIFMIPGILCYILHPNLKSSDDAFITMVTNYLPVGMVGLIVAVLIAATVSTVDSGMNSFSTIFTLDIYIKKYNPDASPKKIKSVGRYVTVFVAIFAIISALLMSTAGKGMFELFQSIIAFFAPPIAAVFLLSISWKRVTTKAVLWTLYLGTIICMIVGLLYIYQEGLNKYLINLQLTGFLESSANFIVNFKWPHFLFLSFLLFIVNLIILIIVSFITNHSPEEKPFPSLLESNKETAKTTKRVWLSWAVLAGIMLSFYGFFQYLSHRTNDGPWPSSVIVYKGSTPKLDGIISKGEWDDATEIDNFLNWNPNLMPAYDPKDLSLKVYVKHDDENIYFAFDVKDNSIGQLHTLDLLEKHKKNPTFRDSIVLFINASYKWDKNKQKEECKGNGESWGLAYNVNESKLQPYTHDKKPLSPKIIETYNKWIKNASIKVVSKINNTKDKSGYVLEWKIKRKPCLKVSENTFWDPKSNDVKMGLNIAVKDLDKKTENGLKSKINDKYELIHANWWAGGKKQNINLKQWGTMILKSERRPLK